MGPLPHIQIGQVLDCLADPSKIRVVAELPGNVREVLPYLATLLPQAGYNHAAGMLTLVREGRLITVYPQVVTLAKALDEEDAQAVLEWLRGMINDAWADAALLAFSTSTGCCPAAIAGGAAWLPA